MIDFYSTFSHFLDPIKPIDKFTWNQNLGRANCSSPRYFKNEFIRINKLLSCFLINFANSENSRRKHIPTNDCSVFYLTTSMAVDSAKVITYTYLYITMIGTFFVCGNIRIIFFGFWLKSVCLFSNFVQQYSVYLLACLLVSCCYYIIHCSARSKKKKQ